jgi:hypothetical protein
MTDPFPYGPPALVSAAPCPPWEHVDTRLRASRVRQVLAQFATSLNAIACASALSMLGMRCAKLFDQQDVEGFVDGLMPADGGAKIAPAALIAGLRALRRARRT